jgi:hypothetical protein
VVVASLVVLAAGCGGGGGGERTEPLPPDRLDITLTGAQGDAFRVALDCGVADRAACSEILEAIAEEQDAEACEPIADTGERIVVRGLIEGQEVGAALDRRTDCEARLFDRVNAALGP